MKIDFHTHGKLAKNLPFSAEYTKWLFREAKATGLDALCLTEHFNTMYFDELYEYIYTNYPKEGDCFIVEGIKVFPGMEIDVAEEGHILVIGTIENIIALNHSIEPNKRKGEFLTFSELVKHVKPYNVFIGAAHPFREGSKIPTIKDELLSNLNFIDLNGKDYAMKGEIAREEVLKFAHRLNLPVIAGSDTHQAFQYCSIFNEFAEECTTIDELMFNISKGKYKIRISEDITLKVKTAGILKKALKSIHACGGNYVSILTE